MAESNNLPTLTRAAEPRTGPFPLSPPHMSSVVSCKTPVIGFRAHLGNLEYHPKVLHLIASAKTLFPKKVTFTGSGDLDVGMTLGESPFTPLWGHHSQHILQAPGQGHKHGEKRVFLMAVLCAASSINVNPKKTQDTGRKKATGRAFPFSLISVWVKLVLLGQGGGTPTAPRPLSWLSPGQGGASLHPVLGDHYPETYFTRKRAN